MTHESCDFGSSEGIACPCGHSCEHGPHDGELDHEPESGSETQAPGLGWWVISGEDFMSSLKRAADGESAGTLYAEMYVNSDHEYVPPNPVTKQVCPTCEETEAAHAYMVRANKIMRREKEHGWREADKWETRCEELQVALTELRKEVTTDAVDALVDKHWLRFDSSRQVDGCACGYFADTDSDSGWGDSIVRHLIEVGIQATANV